MPVPCTVNRGVAGQGVRVSGPPQPSQVRLEIFINLKRIFDVWILSAQHCMNLKCFKPFTKVHPNNPNIHETSSASGDFIPPNPYTGACASGPHCGTSVSRVPHAIYTGNLQLAIPVYAPGCFPKSKEVTWLWTHPFRW